MDATNWTVLEPLREGQHDRMRLLENHGKTICFSYRSLKVPVPVANIFFQWVRSMGEKTYHPNICTLAAGSYCEAARCTHDGALAVTTDAQGVKGEN